MPDLRTLSDQERRALATEAARRARAGEAPQDIRDALGLSRAIYTQWAKRYRFRQADLTAAQRSPEACPDPPELSVEPDSAASVLATVRAALAVGDRAQADRLVASWSARRRRDKALATLEAEVALAAARKEDAAELNDEALLAEVSALIGREIRLIPSE
ncbi:MAG: hypothetical protein AAFY12_16630 [Pseudomonadota bacterium]